MSGLAGIVRWDGAPVDDDALRRLATAIDHRGLDGLRILCRGSAAMLFAQTITTPEAAGDMQPIEDRESGAWVTFDGRLDNREELAAALGINGSLDAVPDALLVLAAYKRWGVDFAGRLLGDFAAAVWDARRRQLLAARDVMGMRPIYYRADHVAFLWSSEMGALADGAPNEGYLGEILADRITSCDETIHRGVMRLPMAHTLVARPGGSVRSRRYWRPAPDARIRYRNEREYDDHFRALFRQAVRARLRVRGGAALSLSGGVDSASIAAQIGALRREGLETADRVEAFSRVVPGHPGDEGPAIRAIVARTGLPSTCLAAGRVAESDFVSDAEASLDLPTAPDCLQQTVSRRGFRVFLTGMGGDEWFFGSIGELSDLLLRARLGRAAWWLYRTARVPGRPSWTTMLQMGAWMALPEPAKPRVRRILRRRAVPHWLEAGFAASIDLEDRLRARPDVVEFAAIAPHDIFRAATSGEAVFLREQSERAAARDGLEVREPYHDRRLIEFSLAIPADVRCAGGLPKGLVRRALSEMLPPQTTGMPPGTDFGFLWVQWLDSLGGSARIRATRPCVRRWVRGDAVASMYEDMAHGLTRHLWPIWSMFTTDIWLRTLEASALVLRRSRDSEARITRRRATGQAPVPATAVALAAAGRVRAGGQADAERHRKHYGRGHGRAS